MQKTMKNKVFYPHIFRKIFRFIYLVALGNSSHHFVLGGLVSQSRGINAFARENNAIVQVEQTDDFIAFSQKNPAEKVVFLSRGFRYSQKLMPPVQKNC